MSNLPIDLALMLAGIGINIHLDEDELELTLRTEIGERRGYLGSFTVVDEGWKLDLLYPVRETFSGRTRVMAYAWCLIYLMGESGEIGINAVQA